MKWPPNTPKVLDVVTLDQKEIMKPLLAQSSQTSFKDAETTALYGKERREKGGGVHKVEQVVVAPRAGH